jgi:hypothetical protein
MKSGKNLKIPKGKESKWDLVVGYLGLLGENKINEAIETPSTHSMQI